MNEEQKQHVIESIAKNIRFDGRKNDEFRDIVIETNISKNAEGSARVKLGDCEVIAGVKLMVDKPFPDTPDEGVLMVNTELLPLSSDRFEPGPPSIEAVEISRVVDRGIRESHAIDVKKLCLIPGEKVWSVGIDICSINANGNLLDAAGIAAMVALENALFPEYNEKECKIDYEKKTNKRLPLLKRPIPITVYKVGGYLLVDPLPLEEEASDSRLTITTTADSELCALQKGGDVPLSIEDIDSMVALALKKADAIRKKFNV